MTIPVLICDDSSIARKQIARQLPDDWDIEITFAKHGKEAISAIEAGKGHITFLDLNMPIMDGFQALEVIYKQSLPTVVIVVSGDIQPEAKERVLNLGALGFLKKPFDSKLLTDLLKNYGLYEPASNAKEKPDPMGAPLQKKSLGDSGQIESMDCIREVCNVAMGQAGDLLSRLLGAFIQLPVPNVNILEVSELQMALTMSAQNSSYSAVCQGFIGSGIVGEALLIFDDTSFTDMASLMSYKGEITRAAEVELLMDVASILTGAFINGLASQLDLEFSQGHPIVLGQHVNVADLVKANSKQWKKTMAIEVTYKVENHNITCELLLLITEDSVDVLNERLSYLLDEG